MNNFRFHAGFMLMVAVVWLALTLIFPEKAEGSSCIVPLMVGTAIMYLAGPRLRSWMENRFDPFEK